MPKCKLEFVGEGGGVSAGEASAKPALPPPSRGFPMMKTSALEGGYLPHGCLALIGPGLGTCLPGFKSQPHHLAARDAGYLT